MVDSIIRKGGKPLKLDKVWLAFVLGFALLYLVDQSQFRPSVDFTLFALWEMAPFILVSILFAAYAKASGLDGQVARIFSGHPVQAIFMAAVLGAFSPFCSCGVVPIIAGLLGAGVPLAPVFAFWLASPLMDPEMFVLMLGVFGLELTLVKTFSAFALGLSGGIIAHALVGMAALSNPLRAQTTSGSCCSKNALKTERVVWAFWQDKGRLKDWNQTFSSTGLFLFKWLALAFFIESLMLRYVPAEMIAQYLGGGAWWSVPLAVIAGIPAYLNGYAAIPTVNGLIDLGMSPAAGLGFMVGGGVTSIPAAMAVFALVKKEVFSLYLLCGLGGALLVSFGYLAYLSV